MRLKLTWRVATSLCLTAIAAAFAAKGSGNQRQNDDLRSGRNFLATQVYSEEEDRAILERFSALRVADVSDGMDQVGLSGIGRMSADIRPLWKDMQDFGHRIVGVAVTARYVPTNQRLPGQLAPREFDAWVGQWYRQRSPEPFVPLIRPGTALVIEDAQHVDVGSIGSNNIMSWKVRGCVGVVTSATARDTDEITIERIPLYFRQPGRGIRPGRNEIESVNRPIVCGGALVLPGDVIVADGDGVIVVPRQHAEPVAAYAHKILDEDKASRRELYKKLGLPEDPTIR